MTGKLINDQFSVRGSRVLKRRAEYVVSDHVQKGCFCAPFKKMRVRKRKSICITQTDDRTFHKGD